MTLTTTTAPSTGPTQRGSTTTCGGVKCTARVSRPCLPPGARSSRGIRSRRCSWPAGRSRREIRRNPRRTASSAGRHEARLRRAVPGEGVLHPLQGDRICGDAQVTCQVAWAALLEGDVRNPRRGTGEECGRIRDDHFVVYRFDIRIVNGRRRLIACVQRGEER